MEKELTEETEQAADAKRLAEEREKAADEAKRLAKIKETEALVS